MTSDVRRPSGRHCPSPIPLMRRIYGLGSVFGKTLRDSRRATLLVGGLLGLILIGVSRAIVVRVLDRRVAPADREPRRGGAADPPGTGRAAGQRRDAGRLPLVQVRRVLPARRQPVVDPRPVGDARRRSPTRKPGVRRRDAADAPADRPPEAVRAHRRRRDRLRPDLLSHRRRGLVRDAARRRDPASRPRPATRSGSA